ncbi:MAG: hypothetical protein U0800_18635 [Isosphaeraceae bacterium]
MMDPRATEAPDRHQTDQEKDRQYEHAQAIFSVSSGMIGVCLTGIGLVKIVSADGRFESICDALLVVDAILFGVTAFGAFRWMYDTIRRKKPRPLPVIVTPFFVALGLMIIICALFGWDML